MFRETYGFVPSATNAYAAYTKAPYLKAPPPPPVHPWSFYMQANGGIRDRQATVASNGFNLGSVGGTIGTEYRINNNAFVGGAFDYSNPKARLFNNAGTTDVNSYQLGIYGAWADPHFFAQGLATFGWQNFRNTRPGVVDIITSNPDGNTFLAAGKAGYLFDAGRSQLGPSGGLTNPRPRVNGYTQPAESVLPVTPSPHTAPALVVSAGVQFRIPFMVNGRGTNPYLNLTTEDCLIVKVCII